MLGKTKKQDFSGLQQTVDKDDYIWLEVHNKDYLDSVEQELRNGKTPDEIYHYLLRQVGHDRGQIARRCRNAARHAVREIG